MPPLRSGAEILKSEQFVFFFLKKRLGDLQEMHLSDRPAEELQPDVILQSHCKELRATSAGGGESGGGLEKEEGGDPLWIFL